jgi:DNA-binding response OmpR family regulator
MANKLIYVVDDEQNIRDLIKTYLMKEGYEVQIFADGSGAFEAFSARPADMLIIDIMMPGMDGYTLCKEIRKTSDVPIIMVSAKDDEIDRILGLELGSDDYMAKPFSPRELVVRAKTIFRRVREDVPVKTAEHKEELKCQDIVIFPDERRVMKEAVEIELTSKEFEFLCYLVKNRNRVFTREQLIQNIWGYDYIGDTRAIDDLVKRVRKKLGEAGASLEIITVWGYGYKVSESVGKEA